MGVMHREKDPEAAVGRESLEEVQGERPELRQSGQ